MFVYTTAFAHTHCISPSVCLLKSFMQASTFAPSPLAARASAIRSRTCGRQRLAFLAVSATGGARKPNPSEGGEGAPAPCSNQRGRVAKTKIDIPLWGISIYQIILLARFVHRNGNRDGCAHHGALPMPISPIISTWAGSKNKNRYTPLGYIYLSDYFICTLRTPQRKRLRLRPPWDYCPCR